jgi:hypothetical protein
VTKGEDIFRGIEKFFEMVSVDDYESLVQELDFKEALGELLGH